MTPDHIGATLLMLAALGGLVAWIRMHVTDDEGDDRSNVDRHGIDRTPGQEPREVGLP